MQEFVGDDSGTGHRPAGHDQRGLCPALIGGGLEVGQRGVGHLGPGSADGDERALPANILQRVIEVLRDVLGGVGLVELGLLGVGAIVGHKEHHGVLPLAQTLQLVEQPTELVVHTLDHRGIDLHLAGLAPLFIRGEVVPGREEPAAGIDL